MPTLVSAPAGPPDWAAIERGIAGDRFLRLRPVERAEAVRQLTQLGLSTRQTAERLGVSERTVTRWRIRGRP